MSRRALVDGERASVATRFVPVKICVSSYNRDLRCLKTDILSTRSARNKTCLHIKTTTRFTIKGFLD